jgi:hypothetical protein
VGGYLVELEEEHDSYHDRLDFLGDLCERGFDRGRKLTYEVKSKVNQDAGGDGQRKHPVLYEFDESGHGVGPEVQISQNN